MQLYHPLFAVVVVLIASISNVAAHSSATRLLKRVANPSTISLEIIPRRPSSDPLLHAKRHHSLASPILRYDDSIRLILSAFDETFYLHLRPTDNLIHPNAQIRYYTHDADGNPVLSETKPLLREDVKAFSGEVVAEEYTTTRMREDAAHVIHQPHGADLGWARIIIHDQGDSSSGRPPTFEGSFEHQDVIYHITTLENYLRHRKPLEPLPSAAVLGDDGHLVIWKETDLMTGEEELVARFGQLDVDSAASITEGHACGHDDLSFNKPSQNPFLQPRVDKSWLSHLLLKGSERAAIQKRQDVRTGNDGMGANFINSIGSTNGCSVSQRVVYMGVAADCEYVKRYTNQEGARNEILKNWNSVSALYKSSFNVSIAIQTLTLVEPSCPPTESAQVPWNVGCGGINLKERLSRFSDWRGKQGEDGLGLWHLMSGCPSGSEVGIAWLATLCQQTATGNDTGWISGTGVSTAQKTEWQIVAHEIGHNFGAIHDCETPCTLTDECCPLSSTVCDAGKGFVMSKTTQENAKIFSPCSIGNICTVLGGSGGRVSNACLVEPDPTRQTISLATCGNGIVEKGEDCDPGTGQQSSCCDANCKFRSGAVCDPESSPCCTGECQFASASQVCRPARDPFCDKAEMCTGNSSSCPTDAFAANGLSCGSDGLACASGQCTSLNLQCQNSGRSLGLQRACSDRNLLKCTVACQSPSNPATCLLTNTLNIDGSPCGYGGTCVDGKCKDGPFLDAAKAWYLQNLQISIPVTVVAGLIFLILLWAIIRGLARCCSRGDLKKTKATRSSTLIMPPVPMMQQQTAAHTRMPSYEPPPRHPDQQQQQWDSAGAGVGAGAAGVGAAAGRSRSQRHARAESGSGTPRVPGASRRRESYTARWVDETTYNGTGGGDGVVPEPAAYDTGNGYGGGNGYGNGYGQAQGYGQEYGNGYGAPDAGYSQPGYNAAPGAGGYARR